MDSIITVNALEFTQMGKYFNLFAASCANVTKVYLGIGLVGNGLIYKDSIFADMVDLEVEEIEKGFLKLEELGFLVTSKIYSNRRSIAVIGFEKFLQDVDHLEIYDDCFDQIFGELNDIVLNSRWDVTKIKNSNWFQVYLDINRYMLSGNAITFDENK